MPGAAEIRAAAATLQGVAERTPVVPVPGLAERVGAPVALKCEHLQPIGAFKIRGAYNAIARLSPEARARGVVTHSSGNHGQAVAFAAKAFGIRGVIVMPEDAAQVKVDGVRRHGGEIVFVKDRRDRDATARALAEREGLTLIPPYENPDVIAGQATCGLEILEQCPDVRTILVPVGGGGLIAGIAAAVRAFRPSVEVVGVEPAGSPKLTRALAAGRPERLETSQSIADGLMPFVLGELPFAVMRGVVRRAIEVSEDEIASAVRYIFEGPRLRVEPSGAVTTAALLSERFRPQGSVVAVVSGGNVDLSLFERLTSAS